MKVAVVKYNAGNIRSVDYALKRLGVEAVITADEAVLRAADKVIFPGVGEAETTMDFLRAGGMDRLIKELRQPVLGICLGMQVAVIEYARHICGMDDANSTEFDQKTTHPVISLQEEQKGIKAMGATMRLGAYKALIRPGTLAHKLYGKDSVTERHRHRYEFNPSYRDELEKASGSADNMRRQIKDYLEDAASAKMAAEEARRENASLKRRIDELERRLRRSQFPVEDE